MSTPEEHENPLVGQVRATYHVPPETPREKMWAAISAGIAEVRSARAAAPVADLAEARRTRGWRHLPASWAAAAAALVLLGIGIGRMSSGGIEAPAVATAVPEGPEWSAAAGSQALELAAREHLGRTESLLSMVRADARTGALDPATVGWARGLLAQTRLLIDARPDADLALSPLLEDLELVLIQIVGVAEAGPQEAARTRTELELTLQGMDQGEVLPRLRAVVPMMEGA